MLSRRGVGVAIQVDRNNARVGRSGRATSLEFDKFALQSLRQMQAIRIGLCLFKNFSVHNDEEFVFVSYVSYMYVMNNSTWNIHKTAYLPRTKTRVSKGGDVTSRNRFVSPASSVVVDASLGI